jgi:predicted ATPase
MVTRPRRSRRQRSLERGITSLWVEGYKSLRERQNIEILPLTILAGVNSSGKSSIIQPLLLLKQTLDASYDPGPLQLDGSNVSVTAIEQVLSKESKRKQVKKFTVGLSVDGTQSVSVSFGKSSSGQLELIDMTLENPDIGRPITLIPNMSSSELEKLIPKEVRDTITGPRREQYTLRVLRDRCFLRPQFVSEGLKTTFSYGALSASNAQREVARIIHLPALRGNPSRTYRATAVGATFPGTFETYVAGIIRAWHVRENGNALSQLRSDLEELGLTWKVEARQLDDTRVELLVGRLPRPRRGGAWDLVNIVDVGFGVSQTLPVLVGLIVAQPGQLIYLEQPEIHLHPRAQVRFAAIAARAARRGVRVVIETHSSLLIRGIQTLVARNELSEEFVKLHWFTRSPDDGFSQVVSGELDESGAFGDWPEDFDEVLLDAERDYLDAAEFKVARQ